MNALSPLFADAPPVTTIRALIDARAETGAPGFVFPEGAPDLSWPDLRDRACAVAADLTARGVQPGESVAIMHPNGREALISLFGTLYGGFRAAMVNLSAGPDVIAYVLEHSEARFAFVADSQRDLFEAANRSGVEAIAAAKVSPRDVHLHPVTPETEALLMYTSGTTGRPKGVLHSNRSLLAGGWTTAIAHRLRADDVGFCVLPLYHINGLCVTLMATLLSGGRLAVVEKFSARRFWDQLEVSRATWFSVVPTIISHLMQSHTGPDPASQGRIRFGRSASSALAPEVQRGFEERFGIPVVETMGLTETAAQILSNPLPPGLRKIGSPGIAFGNEVEILGPDFQPLPPDTEGEIAVRGPNVMLGYLKNPEATQAAFAPGGWLLTGDLGRKDAEGYVFVTGRLKELIIKGGENIAPREIDEALYAHADVVEAAAFARACPSYGERVEAAVALREGSDVTEEMLLALCTDRLGRFKCPDRIHFFAELPKGPSGKIQRMKLVELTQAVAA